MDQDWGSRIMGLPSPQDDPQSNENDDSGEGRATYC